MSYDYRRMSLVILGFKFWQKKIKNKNKNQIQRTLR